jgi:hypothetical protein
MLLEQFRYVQHERLRWYPCRAEFCSSLEQTFVSAERINQCERASRNTPTPLSPANGSKTSRWTLENRQRAWCLPQSGQVRAVSSSRTSECVMPRICQRFSTA